MIDATDVKQVFAGDGTDDVRNTSIRVFEADDLVIYKLTDATPPVESLLIDGVDYTLALGSPLPATVAITPLAVIPATITWIVYRSSDFTQDTDWVNAETFPSAAHENAADRAVMLAQDLDFYRSRSIRLSPLDTNEDMELPRKEARLDKIAAYGAVDGEPIAILRSDIPIDTVTMTADGQALIEATNFDAMRADSVLQVPKNNGGVDKINAAPIAARPTPAAFGPGVYYATDTQETFISNGSTWTINGVEQGLFSTRPAAALADKLFLATDQKLLYRDNGTIWQALNALPKHYGEGFNLSKTGDDQLTVGPGVCQSINAIGGETVRLELTVALAKEIDMLYSPGDGGGGKPGSHTFDLNSFYRVFVVGKDDGTTVMGIDRDVTPTASALRSTVAQKEGGTWNHYRQVMWVRTDASTNIADFIQHDDTILFQSGTVEETDADLKVNRDWVAAGVTITLDRCPPDTFGLFRYLWSNAAASDGFRLGPMVEDDDPVDATDNVGSTSTPPSFLANNNGIAAGEMEIWVDANQQIRGRSEGDVSTNLELNTRGFRYDRFAIPD